MWRKTTFHLKCSSPKRKHPCPTYSSLFVHHLWPKVEQCVLGQRYHNNSPHHRPEVVQSHVNVLQWGHTPGDIKDEAQDLQDQLWPQQVTLLLFFTSWTETRVSNVPWTHLSVFHLICCPFKPWMNSAWSWRFLRSQLKTLNNIKCLYYWWCSVMSDYFNCCWVPGDKTQRSLQIFHISLLLLS